jgi:hypothetical protein
MLTILGISPGDEPALALSPLFARDFEEVFTFWAVQDLHSGTFLRPFY